MTHDAAGPTVLFVKLSAIGDIVMASGLPSNIKSGLGASRIIWLVESPYVNLVEGHPDIAEVIPWPKQAWRELAKARQWRQLWRAMMTLRQQLRQQQIDIAIDAQGLLKSAFLCWLSGATKRIGFTSKEKSHWLLTQSIEKPVSSHISSEYIALGKILGGQHYRMHLPATAQVMSQVNDLRRQYHLNAPFLVICPYTTRAQKHWPQQHWQQLLTMIAHRWSAPIVILGGPGDSEAAQALSLSASTCLSLAGELTLAQSGAMLAHAQAVIGVDTGLTHLAIAHMRPVLALFGSTCPYTLTPNSQATVLYEALPCAPCKRKPTCDGAFTCMSALTPQRVMNWLENTL